MLWQIALLPSTTTPLLAPISTTSTIATITIIIAIIRSEGLLAKFKGFSGWVEKEGLGAAWRIMRHLVSKVISYKYLHWSFLS